MSWYMGSTWYLRLYYLKNRLFLSHWIDVEFSFKLLKIFETFESFAEILFSW